MRYLVTGATGFLGRRVVPLLVAAGHDVHGTYVEEEPPAVPGVTWHRVDLLGDGDGAVRSIQATELLHLAWYAEHGKFWRSPENLSWVAASLRLVRAFHEAGGRRVTVAGSCAEYEWGGMEPLEERRSPMRPRTLYGVSKDALRRVLESYASDTGLGWAWGRIFLLYGPGEDRRRFVASIIRALQSGTPAEMSHGRQIRDFLHADDVAGALVAIHASGVTGPVNVASGFPVTLLEVAQAVQRRLGGEIAAGARQPAPDDPPSLVADVARLRSEVGFVPQFDLATGLDATIASVVQPTRRS